MTDLSAYNQFTIRENGEGQIVGRAAEQEFSCMVIQKGCVFSYHGPSRTPFDFQISDVTIDLKCKERNVDALPHYEAHVDWRLRNKDVHLYVFASYNGRFQWLGWIGKKQFWEKAVRVERGELRDGFTEREDAGKLAYSELRPMDELFEKLKEKQK